MARGRKVDADLLSMDDRLSFEDAFVSMVDGYLHVRGIDRLQWDVVLSDLPDSTISTLIHEVTHHLTLSGVLAEVVAYLVGSSSTTKLLEELDLPPEGTPARAYLERIAATFYPDHIDVCMMLIGGLRWLWEGLATFAQIDWIKGQSSTRHTSGLTFFVLVMLASGPSQTSPEQATTLLERWAAFSARIDAYRDGDDQLWRLFNEPDPEGQSVPYFAGYLIIRSLQSHLARLDKRLRNPATMLTLLTGYFVNDARLLEICDLADSASRDAIESTVTNWLQLHIERCLKELLSADARHVRRAVNRIEKSERYKRSYFIADFARAFRGEPARAIPYGDHLRQIGRRIRYRDVYKFIHSEASASISGEMMALLKYIDRIVAKRSDFMFRGMLLLTNLVRLSSTQIFAVAYQRTGDEVTVFWWSMQMRKWVVSTTGAEIFEDLLDSATTTGLALRDLADSTSDLGDMASILAELHAILDAWTRDHPNSPLAERFLEGRRYIVYEKTEGALLDIVWRITYARVAILAAPEGREGRVVNVAQYPYVALMFERDHLFTRVQAGHPIDPGVSLHTLTSAWSLVFPGATRDGDRLIQFWKSKLGVIAPGANSPARQLLDRLFHGESMRVARDSADHQRAQAINLRWAERVGVPLLREQAEADGWVLLELSL